MDSQDERRDCPVCLEETGAWEALKCRHSFCLTCLATLSAGSSLKCPLCREITWVIDGKFVKYLPKEPKLVKSLKLSCFIGYVCLEEKTERLLVATNDSDKPIQLYNYNCELVGSIGKGVVSGSGPSVTLDTKRGHVVANDERKVAVFDFETGKCISEITNPAFRLLQGIAYHCGLDQYIVTDCRKHSVMFIDPLTEQVVKTIGSPGSGDTNFYWPSDICCDKTGSSPHFAVSDKDNYCIKRFDAYGTFVDKFGKEGEDFGEFSQIYGTCMDEYGRVMTADAANCRVVRVTPNEKDVVRSWECVLPPGRCGDEEPLVVDVDTKGHMAAATGLSGSSGSTLHFFNEYE